MERLNTKKSKIKRVRVPTKPIRPPTDFIDPDEDVPARLTKEELQWLI